MRVESTTTIAAPSDQVFAAASDPETQLKWDDTLLEVEKLSDGPLAKGSRYRGKFKRMGTVEYEYVDFEAGRRFSHEAEMPLGLARHTIEVAPEGDGTRMHQTLELEPKGLGRALAPVMKPMFRRRLNVIEREVPRYLAG